MKKQGTRSKSNRKQIFWWMLSTLTKGWYLCCYKYRLRNLNVIQILILVKAAFFLEGIQRSSLIIKKSNKQIKTGILMKLMKNSVIIATSLWTRYYIKKFGCERSHWHNPPPLLFAYVRILMDTNERNNRMPHIRSGPRTEPCEISCCLIFLPTKNSHRLK